MPAPIVCARRSLLLAAAAIAVPFRAAASAVRSVAVRSVYHLEAEAWLEYPSWMTCDRMTLNREAGVAVVAVTCRTRRGEKVPRRGGTVWMQADVTYAESGQDIGSCEASKRVKKAGAVTVSCSVPIPAEPTLPIVVTGTGLGVSEPFRLPGGTLVIETTVDPVPERYARVELVMSDGYTVRLWENYPVAQPTVSVVEPVDMTTDAVIEASVPGSWRVEITEAFP